MQIAKSTIWTGLFFLVCLGAAVGSYAEDAERVVAVGDGFTITHKDVNDVRDYLASQAFRSSDEEYRNAALRFHMFAEEAKRLGLGDEAVIAKIEEPLGQTLYLQHLYLVKALDDYTLKDLAVETYYYAHPELYYEKDVEAGQYVPRQPLDEALRKEIRALIMKAKLQDIVQQKYEDLKEKYDVRLCDSGEEGCR